MNSQQFDPNRKNPSAPVLNAVSYSNQHQSSNYGNQQTSRTNVNLTSQQQQQFSMCHPIQNYQLIQQMNLRIINLERIVGYLQKKVVEQDSQIRKLSGLPPLLQMSNSRRTNNPNTIPIKQHSPKPKVVKKNINQFKKISFYDYGGNCLDIMSTKDGEQLIAWEARGGKSQQFVISSNLKDWTIIQCFESKKFLEERSSSSIDKDSPPRVIQSSRKNSDSQLWKFVHVEGEYVAIENKMTKKFVRSNGIGNEVGFDNHFDNLENRFRIIYLK